MATKFPLQLNNLRFFVNPTQLAISKGVNYAQLATQNGPQFQVWYNTPEVLTITGMCAGSTAYQELVFLKTQFEKADKLSQLFYKTRLYNGFITNMTVEAAVGHLGYFNYTIQFQLLFGQQFAIEDFSLTGNEVGPVEAAINRVASIINAPIAGLQSTLGKITNSI
jgi:hypothetical protein